MSSLSAGDLKPLSISAELLKPLSSSTEALFSRFEGMQLETPRSRFLASLAAGNIDSIACGLDNAFTKLSDLELAVGVFVILQHADHIYHIQTVARALLQMCCRLSTVNSCSVDGWNTFFSLVNPGCEIPYERLAHFLEDDEGSDFVEDAFRHTTVETLKRLFSITTPALLAAIQTEEISESILSTFASFKEKISYFEFAAYIADPVQIQSSKDAVSESIGVWESVMKFIQLSQNSETKRALFQEFAAKCHAADWKCMKLLTLKHYAEFVDLSNELKVPLNSLCLTAVMEHAKATSLAKLGLGFGIMSQISFMDFKSVKKLFAIFVAFVAERNPDVYKFLFQLIEGILSRGWVCEELNIYTFFEDSIAEIEGFINGVGSQVLHAVYPHAQNDAVYVCFALGLINRYEKFAANSLKVLSDKGNKGDFSQRTADAIEYKRTFLQILAHIYNKIIDKKKKNQVFAAVLQIIHVTTTNSALEPILKVDNFHNPTSIHYNMLNEMFVMTK